MLVGVSACVRVCTRGCACMREWSLYIIRGIGCACWCKRVCTRGCACMREWLLYMIRSRVPAGTRQVTRACMAGLLWPQDTLRCLGALFVLVGVSVCVRVYTHGFACMPEWL
jgi:hypothetical protein